MDKNKLISLQPSERVKMVNKLLEEHSFEEICEMFGLSTGTFSKILREGNYFYHKADKKYYPYVHSEEERIQKNNPEKSDELTFIKNKIDTIKRIIQQYEESGNLLLDKKIYDNNANYVNKTIRINSDIYDSFIVWSKQHYPHLKSQDLLAQSLLDLMKRYTPER